MIVGRIEFAAGFLVLTLLATAPARGQYSPIELSQPFKGAPETAPPLPLQPPVTRQSPVSDNAGQSVAQIGDSQSAAASVQPQVEFVGLSQVSKSLLEEAAEVWRSAEGIWNIVLIRGSDNKPLMTIGTLAGGLVLLGFGYVAAGIISRWLAGKLLARFGMNKSAIAPLQSITFYALLSTFTMLSLNVLNVPIAVFSFLGGALAIGAGFGSQNIVNNFISGLILLAERPIRVGDVIQVDGLIGSVAQIGARSTRLQTGMNHEIIIPNSKLLETNVVNWTLSDDSVCTIITVGVAYGSPTREVERLLKLAAMEHSKVLKDPLPEALFMDFGADSLTFELRFWVRLRQTRKIEVESELRFRIDELLADRGIVIAYPQRDVHLNLMRPVEVRLTQPFVPAHTQPLSQTRGAA